MELGKKIRLYRLKAGLTQEQLADRLGVTAQSVSKWENAVAMSDITLLPMIAEVFGVSIDDMFDLSVEQRLNRIENRLDIEPEIPQDIFWEYEEFLKQQCAAEQYKKRATNLIAYLYWQRSDLYSKKACRYAKEAIQADPGEKESQWVLQQGGGHAAWDWNMSNHSKAIEFYGEIVKKNPDVRLPYLYLIDNLLADHRADEAEEALNKLVTLKDANPVMCEVYRAHIALARFDEKTADAIIGKLVSDHPDDSASLFEAAQYYARKCDYDLAIEYYERSFANETRRPRFTDELMAIADIYEIRGEYGKAAETYDRMIGLLKDEWGYTEEIALRDAEKEKARLLSRI